jgi:hypothetical protein
VTTPARAARKTKKTPTKGGASRAKKGGAARVTPGAAANAAAEPLFAPVLAAFVGDKHIGTGKMFGALGLKTHGKWFAMLYKGNFVAKLPAERVGALLNDGAGRPFSPGPGRVMREWVEVSPKHSERWVALAKEARAFIEAQV